jgi:hypothetical protein
LCARLPCWITWNFTISNNATGKWQHSHMFTC